MAAVWGSKGRRGEAIKVFDVVFDTDEHYIIICNTGSLCKYAGSIGVLKSSDWSATLVLFMLISSNEGCYRSVKNLCIEYFNLPGPFKPAHCYFVN